MSKEYYNSTLHKSLNDYVQGNERIEKAILRLSSFIPPNSKIVADLGCGVGWSSFEFSRFFPNTIIHGFDLSDVLIENAQKLFQNKNLEYFNLDLTKDMLHQKYDCILMIDVYEHISIEERKSFHKLIKNKLSDNGRLILACPTKFYQDWLRKYKPERLQPIDEDVDPVIVNKLAKDIGGELVYFEYQTIWHNYDYFYAVVQLNPNYKSDLYLNYDQQFNLENKSDRVAKVLSNLNIDLGIPKEQVKNKKPLKKLLYKTKGFLHKYFEL